jgi:hypothetical protein
MTFTFPLFLYLFYPSIYLYCIDGIIPPLLTRAGGGCGRVKDETRRAVEGPEDALHSQLQFHFEDRETGVMCDVVF